MGIDGHKKEKQQLQKDMERAQNKENANEASRQMNGFFQAQTIIPPGLCAVDLLECRSLQVVNDKQASGLLVHNLFLLDLC